jgi:hypothetical protein
MTAAQVDEWAERLKAGTLNLTDLGTAEGIHGSDIVNRLRSLFPIHFFERRQRSKWEVGLAQTRRRHATVGRASSSRTPLEKRTATTDTFHHCLFLTSESERLTTVAVMSLLRVRTPRGENELVELISGAGFSLYRDPDGWKIKLLQERSISLNRKALQERGWRLEPEGSASG